MFRSGAAAACFSLVHALAAMAAADVAGPIAGSGLCPDPQAVWTALSTAIAPADARRLWMMADHVLPWGLVVDDGGGFRAVRGDVERRFDDAGRDCASRARQAAVFFALALDAEAAAPVAQSRAASLAIVQTGPPRWRVEGAALMEHVGTLGLGWGGRLSAAAAFADTWRLLGNVGAAQTMDGRYFGLPAAEHRFFVQAGAEVGQAIGPVDFAAQLLGSIDHTSWRVSELPSGGEDAVWVGGAAAFGRVARANGRWRPFIQLGLQWWPRAPRARLDPQISLPTPAVRPQAWAGVAFTIP